MKSMLLTVNLYIFGVFLVHCDLYSSEDSTCHSNIDIPIISLNDLSLNNASILMNGLQNVGCFYLKDHGISQQVINTAMDGIKTFFSYSNELKSQININKNQRGFLDSSTTSTSSVKAKMQYTNVTDYKQVFFFGPDIQINDTDIGNKPMVALNQWPITFMPELPNQIYPYYNQVMRVGDIILEAIAIGLRLNDTMFFKKYYKKPLGRGQLLYYPVPIHPKTQIYGVGPHTDLGVITVILQDDIGGLQFYSRSYKQWIDVKPIKSTLIINIGDLLEKWTAFKLRSTIHRVINGDRKKNRYGISIFYDPTSDALINAHDIIKDNDNDIENMQFVEPFYAGQYIADLNRKLFAHYQDERYQERGEILENVT